MLHPETLPFVLPLVAIQLMCLIAVMTDTALAEENARLKARFLERRRSWMRSRLRGGWKASSANCAGRSSGRDPKNSARSSSICRSRMWNWDQSLLDVPQEKARRALKGQDAAEKGAPNRNSGSWSPGAVVQAHAPEHVVRPPLSILPRRGNLHPTEDHAGPSDARHLVRRACFHLRPIADHLKERLKGVDRIFMDETRAPVPGGRKTKTGYFWAIVADDRGHGALTSHSDVPLCAKLWRRACAPLPQRLSRELRAMRRL